jgi:hypothetical protein
MPIARPTAAMLAKYVKQNAPKARAAQAGHHMHMDESVREATYKGHHIAIRTTYQVTVDGKPITGHMGVTNDGRVHYHPVPNVSFASAVDLIKQLIDTFPDDFDRTAGHPHPGAPMPMGGMKKTARQKKAPVVKRRGKKTKSSSRK